jgi:hypothetical protein
MLACNRCADYRSRMSSLLHSIRQTCLDYIQAFNSTAQKAMTEEFIAKTRATLSRLTQALAASACRHRGINTIWEPDFIQQLFDMPEKSNKVVAAYLRLLPPSLNLDLHPSLTAPLSAR